jgi:hypothetical protein
MTFETTNRPSSPHAARFVLSVGLLAAVSASACCLKETGAGWKGTYQRYAVSTRNAMGQPRVFGSSAGKASLIIDTNKLTYDLYYGPNNNTHVVQVYTFQASDIAAVKGGHNVRLTWQSMVKTPTNASYYADNITPVLKVRGSGDNRHFELEFSDAKGTQGDIDFSVGGKNLTGIGDADFDQLAGYASRARRSGGRRGGERLEHGAVAPERERGIIPRAFVAQKRVLRVHLVPGERHTGLGQTLADLHAACLGHVGILPAPDHQQLARDVFGAGERIVAAEAEALLVQIGRVKAGRRADAGIEGGAVREMAADADAEREEPPVDVGAREQMVEHGPGIVVVRRGGFGRFVMIARVRASLIVGEHRARRLELVKNFGHRYHVAVAREERRHPMNGPGPLENLREQDEPRRTLGLGRAHGPVHVGAHGPGAGCQRDRLFGEDHGAGVTHISRQKW